MSNDPALDTEELLRLLKEDADFTQTLRKNSTAITNPTLALCLMNYQKTCGLSIAQIADSAMLSQSFVYQVFSGVRNPGRDTLISIALVMRLDLDSTQHLLMLARKGELYPRVRRDAAVIFGIQHGYTLNMLEELLQKTGEASLLNRSL
jgi:transcriptional regulator with XRE-family HTH domain